MSFEHSAPGLIGNFIELLASEKIPVTPATLQSLSSVHLPLADWISRQQHAAPVIIGINGAQGSGKSTLVKVQSLLLEQVFNKRVVCLSIDDFYYGHHKRQQLARDIHPLLATRGVPGTHDVDLGISLLQLLKSGKPGQVRLPVFDKSIDDRVAEQDWPRLELPVDIVLFEGWCVGAIAEQQQALQQPVNALEQDEDRDTTWRSYVNQRLGSAYQDWFGLIDKLVFLEIPGFDKVLEWRQLQESKLDERLMSDIEISRFVMHYERITRHCLAEMPTRADVIVSIDNEHQPGHIQLPGVI